VLEAIEDAIELSEASISATERLRDALVHELLSRGLRGWHTKWRAVPGLGTIPSDWRIVRLGDVYEVQLGKMLSPRARLGLNPQLYLTNKHVQWGHFDLSTLPVMDFDECEMQKFELRSGDLLVCEGGDVGRGAVWEEQIPNCYYQKALHRLRPVDGDSVPRFMLAILMSFHQRGTLLEHSERTSISHLTRTRLLQMRVPHPTRAEQIRIADTVQAVGNRVDCMRTEKQKLQQFKLSLANSLFSGQTRTVPPLSSHGA
jgi:type I restriction enzyme S subunit